MQLTFPENLMKIITFLTDISQASDTLQYLAGKFLIPGRGRVPKYINYCFKDSGIQLFRQQIFWFFRISSPTTTYRK